MIYDFQYPSVRILNSPVSGKNHWTQYDFEHLRDLLHSSSEEYNTAHPHSSEARTLLSSVFNLHELYEILIRAEAGEVTDRHKMQLLYLRRATSPLLTVYLSAKNHLYSVAYGQIRLLLELYLGVRELNRDKDQTEKKFVEFREDLNENEYGDYETLPMTDFFGGKVGQVKGDFKDQHELQRSLYGRISNLGTHPYSIKSTGNDGTYSESQEKDVLDFALIFAYGIAAQYIRTFENSEAEQFVRQEADQVIIQSILATRTLPLFFEEDLEFDFNY